MSGQILCCSSSESRPSAARDDHGHGLRPPGPHAAAGYVLAHGQSGHAALPFLAKNAKALVMRMRKPLWPRNKALPVFATLDEEAAFWQRYDVAVIEGEDGWEEVPPAETTAPTAGRKSLREPLTLPAVGAPLPPVARRSPVAPPLLHVLRPYLPQLPDHLAEQPLRRVGDGDDDDRDPRPAAPFDERGLAAPGALHLNEELAHVGLDDHVDAGVILGLAGLPARAHPLGPRRQRAEHREEPAPSALRRYGLVDAHAHAEVEVVDAEAR